MTVKCLKALISKMELIEAYLRKVEKGELRGDNAIIFKL